MQTAELGATVAWHDELMVTCKAEALATGSSPWGTEKHCPADTDEQSLRAPLAGCSSAYPVYSSERLFIGVCRATLLSTWSTDASLVYDWCCQSPAAPLCKSPSAHRATTTSHQVQPSGVFCCKPDSLELVARLSPWSVAKLRHFQAVIKDIFVCVVLEHVAHQKRLRNALYKFSTYLLDTVRKTNATTILVLLCYWRI